MMIPEEILTIDAEAATFGKGRDDAARSNMERTGRARALVAGVHGVD